jgi:hypothetical protein
LRRIIIISIANLLIAGSAIGQFPNLAPGWPYRSQSRFWVAYGLGRIANDSSDKHLFYSTMMGEMQKFELDGSFSNGWPLYCDTLILGHDSVVLDIDHDGQSEVLTYGTRRIDGQYAYSLIFLIDDNGSVMPGFPISAIDPSGLAASDMNGDNEYEIIYLSRRGGIINCIDRYGISKPGWPIPYPSDINCVAGSFGDLDLDGNNEYIITGDRNIYAFRNDGSMQAGFPVTPEETNFDFYNGIWGSSLADLDHDGFSEIITAGDNWEHWPPPIDSSFIGIYDHNGQPKPGWPRYFPYAIISPVTPSDINNDGSIDLAYQSLYLYFKDLNGMDLPGWPILLTRPTGEIWGSNSDLSIVDLDGDGYSEIFPNFNLLLSDSLGQDSIWYFGHSYLFAFDHLGLLLPGYPLTFRGSNANKPPCFAIDSSTYKLYMSLSSDITTSEIDSVFLALYQYPDSTGPANQWPTLSHDNLHTRNYSFVDRVTSIADEGSPPLPKSAILKQNYPNPFNSSTIIEYTLPKAENITLSLYDILGRKVIELDKGVYPAGINRQTLNLKDYTGGIYFLTLKTEQTQITRKLVYLK